MKGLVILGKIDINVLSPIKKNRAIYCDDCGCSVDCSFGDPREKITTEYADGSKEERWICPDCVYYQWTIFDEPLYNIFDGHWAEH